MLGDLRGVIPPISTPFDAQGNVIHSALAEIVEFQIAAGVHGLIPGGSTGEGHTLTDSEFAAVMNSMFPEYPVATAGTPSAIASAIV